MTAQQRRRRSVLLQRNFDHDAHGCLSHGGLPSKCYCFSTTTSRIYWLPRQLSGSCAFLCSRRRAATECGIFVLCFHFIQVTSVSFCSPLSLLYLRSSKRRRFNAREELDWEKRIRLGWSNRVILPFWPLELLWLVLACCNLAWVTTIFPLTKTKRSKVSWNNSSWIRLESVNRIRLEEISRWSFSLNF